MVRTFVRGWLLSLFAVGCGMGGVEPVLAVAQQALTDGSSPCGTWYLNGNQRPVNGGAGLWGFRISMYMWMTSATTCAGSMFDEEGQRWDGLSNCTWSPTDRTLQFLRTIPGAWQWYRVQIVEGVLVGRFSHLTTTSAQPSISAYQSHITGWNATYIDQDIVPRVFEIYANNYFRGRLRIDRAPNGSFQGRFKIYANDGAGSGGEELEYDIEVTHWDGSYLSFNRYDWTFAQSYSGSVSGRRIEGTFVHNNQPPEPWSGQRAEVLTYGLQTKDATARSTWQERTRARVKHLAMAGGPAPLTTTVKCLSMNDPPVEEPCTTYAPLGFSGYVDYRDDNPNAWPQAYRLQRLRFDYTLLNPYGGTPLTRRAQGFLAIPTSAPPPSGKRPTLLALNGHGGGARAAMNASDWYGYGDAFARRGYVVLSLDIGHRPWADRRPAIGGDYLYGDSDPIEHPAIKAAGFDSDWEEDGERAWDAMRGLDYLLGRFDVDPARILVTGLSMGGEISTQVMALDPRLSMGIPAGYSPDMGVVTYNGNHGCWRWIHADIREYLDAADLHALAAPRPLVVETGRLDSTYAHAPQPFKADKQVARRARAAYGPDAWRYVHYLHPGGHEWHAGDVNWMTGAIAYVQIPAVIEPPAPTTSPAALPWQFNEQTYTYSATLFDYVRWYLQF